MSVIGKPLLIGGAIGKVSGAIASFPDGNGANVRDLTITIDPVQDLHGYEYPWPAGGGKNLGDFVDGYSINSSGVIIPSSTRCATVNPIIIDTSKSYVVSCQRSGKSFIYAVWNGDTLLRRKAATPSGTVLDVSGGTHMYLSLYDNTTVADDKPMVEIGTIPSSYSPYSNECPISGRTGVNAWDSAGSDVWSKYKTVLDSGLAGSIYPVGKQITDRWYKNVNTYYDVPWDIVHYDNEGNAYLKWHYATPDAIPFDEPEAIYAFDGTEQAGVEYYILVKQNYGTGWVADTGIAFTLTEAPAAGDQLVLNTATNNANDPTNGMAWNVYGAGQTTSKQSGTTRNSTSGTKLGETSSSGSGYTNGRVNAPQRVVYGYNRWSQSAFRQWLNSSADAGAWWIPQNMWDRPPALAATIQGFMAGLAPEMLAIVERTTVTTALNTAEGLTETTEDTEDYFWLPSLEEMYITPQLANVEGKDWDYYKALAAEAGLSGKFAVGQIYTQLITNDVAAKTTPVSVRLRSVNRGYVRPTWFISYTGVVDTYYAGYGYRGCPACKIKKTALDPNKERHITVSWQSEAGTVYGGYIHVNADGSAELVVDRVLYEATSVGSVSLHASGNRYWVITTLLDSVNTTEGYPSNMFKNAGGVIPGNWYITGFGKTLVVVPYADQQSITSKSDASAWLAEHPAQFVCPLATPITYQLSDIQVQTLLGQNTMWADCGDVAVEYIKRSFMFMS